MIGRVLANRTDAGAGPAHDIVRARFDATAVAGEPFFAGHAERIGRACEDLAARFAAGGTLFVLGRGAQASDAQHVAVEFVHPVIVGKRALPAIALTSDAGVLTGTAGAGHDLFTAPLHALGQPGDVVLGLCAGAVTADMAGVLEGARRRGLLAVLLSAGGTPPESPAVDHHFAVPTADPLTAQEIHETLYHVLWELVHVFLEHEGGGADRPASDAERQLYPYLFGSSPGLAALHDQVRHSVRQKWRDVCAVRRGMFESHGGTLADAALALAGRVARGGRVLAFGNGGSATDAQDAAADCMVPAHAEWQTIPALALTNDAGVVTAVGNDIGFAHVFARQVEAFGRPEDVALAFSTSGASKNVLHALAPAKARGLLIIAFSGYDGGPLTRSEAVDYCITAPGDYVPRVQEAHATGWHALLAAAQGALARGRARGRTP
jgi:D-sedoheptulose 7-phosphate isomerase